MTVSDRPKLRASLLWTLLMLALLCQVATNLRLRPLRPAIEEMPYPPSAQAMKAMALGDDQFLFRVETSWLQSVGDGGGRVRPLRDYDYVRVIDWMKAVDHLDPMSQSIYFISSTYFGAISDPVAAPPRVRLVADYFREAGEADPETRWSWLVWAASKSRHMLKDPDLSRRIADVIMSIPPSSHIPEWIYLLAPPLYRTAGDPGKSAALNADPAMMARRQRVYDKFKDRLHEIGFDKPDSN